MSNLMQRVEMPNILYDIYSTANKFYFYDDLNFIYSSPASKKYFSTKVKWTTTFSISYFLIYWMNTLAAVKRFYILLKRN